MRYDRRVAFRLRTPGEYDPETGDYAPDAETLTDKMASVMDTSAEMMQLVYGRFRRGSLTVSLQQHFDAPFSDILIDGTAYLVDRRRCLRQKDVFIVSEEL